MAKINVRDRNKNQPLKKPNYEYRFEAAQVAGKRKHITKSGFRTKKEAEIAGAKAYAEYSQSGISFQPTEISVSDYFDYWLKERVVVNLKYNTQRAYSEVIERHIKPKLGFFKLKSLTPATLQAFLNDLKLSGFAKSHIVNIKAIINSALDYAVEPLQFLSNNPMRLVKTPVVTKPKRERIILDTSDWKSIISRFPFGSRFYIPLMIGFYTGVRISECFGLSWDNINLDDSTISIEKQTIKREFGKVSVWCLESLKSISSKRVIKIGETLKNVLAAEKKRQEENEKKYGDLYTVQYIKVCKDEKGEDLHQVISLRKNIKNSLPRVNLVCVDENGELTTSDSFKYASRVIRYELKIAFNYHSFRHTHATLLIGNKAGLKDVQYRLGHSNIQTTLQIYTQTTKESEQRAVDIFENIIKEQ